jgi:glutamyl-tRNA reductase
MEVTSLIVALREKGEAIRKRELERTFATLKDLPPHAQKAIEALSASITNKLLHRPIVYLQNSSWGGENQASAEAAVVRRIFALERVSDPTPHQDRPFSL